MALDCERLLENVDAVLVLLHHPPDAGQVAIDVAQPLEYLPLGFRNHMLLMGDRGFREVCSFVSTSFSSETTPRQFSR